jgi:hypothetical protein
MVKENKDLRKENVKINGGKNKKNMKIFLCITN